MMAYRTTTNNLVFFFIGRRAFTIAISLVDRARQGRGDAPGGSCVAGSLDAFYKNMYIILEGGSDEKNVIARFNGTVPLENFVFIHDLDTTGNTWVDVERNKDRLQAQVLSQALLTVDNLPDARCVFVYELARGFEGGVASFLMRELPRVKAGLQNYVVGIVGVQEGDDPLGIYWSIMSLESIFHDCKAVLALDYEALGNYLYSRHKKNNDEGVLMEHYDASVGDVLFYLTLYHQQPDIGLQPFHKVLDELVMHKELKFMVPAIVTPVSDTRVVPFSSYMESAVHDYLLFPHPEGQPRCLLGASVIIAGREQDPGYTQQVEANVAIDLDVVPYTGGAVRFHYYPCKDNAVLVLQNSTTVRHYLSRLVDEFRMMYRGNAYLHVLEDLDVDYGIFLDVTSNMASLIEAYVETEVLSENFDEELRTLTIEIEVRKERLRHHETTRHERMAPPARESLASLSVAAQPVPPRDDGELLEGPETMDQID